eukprot:3111580-Pyramimonas_sp.AAC.1
MHGDNVDVDASLDAENALLRASAPPTLDHRQLRPEERDLPDRVRNVGRAILNIDVEPLYFASQLRVNVRGETSDEVRKQVTAAHRAGPVPPRRSAVRARAHNTIKDNARLAQDPIFAMLGKIEADESESALKFLKAEFGSDDRPDSLPQE